MSDAPNPPIPPAAQAFLRRANNDPREAMRLLAEDLCQRMARNDVSHSDQNGVRVAMTLAFHLGETLGIKNTIEAYQRDGVHKP